jgi:hypothetical protein
MTERLDGGGLSPAESLALIEQQQGRVERTLGPNIILLYGTWGAAWFLGFAMLYLAYRGGMPLVVGGLVFAGLQLAAIVVTGVHIARATRGVRGVSSEVGAMYGWGWLLGFGCVGAIITGLVRVGITEEQSALLNPALSLLVVGLLYLGGGALWRDRVQYGLGVWILATDAVSMFAGVPGNYLVLSIAGGGGFLLAAAWFAVRRRAVAP